MDGRYYFSNIRRLLTEGFTLEELRRLCYDEPSFRPVYHQLADDSRKEEIIDRLIEYADQKLLVDSLLSWAKANNPAMYDQYQPYDRQGVEIPLVIAAMTHQEAQGLFSGTAFDDSVSKSERNRFQQFREAIQKQSPLDFPLCYGDTRESWVPPSQNKTISETISDTINHINQAYFETAGTALIRPKFISEAFFSANEQERAEAWRLGETGGLIIIDPISLFHPWLHRTLLQSQVSSIEYVAILILSPISFKEIPVNQLLEREISKRIERVSTRFNRGLDKLSEFGPADLRTLQRWLVVTLPEIANNIQKPKPYPANQKLVREKMEQMGKISRGIRPVML